MSPFQRSFHYTVLSQANSEVTQEPLAGSKELLESILMSQFMTHSNNANI